MTAFKRLLSHLMPDERNRRLGAGMLGLLTIFGFFLIVGLIADHSRFVIDGLARQIREIRYVWHYNALVRGGVYLLVIGALFWFRRPLWRFLLRGKGAP